MNFKHISIVCSFFILFIYAILIISLFYFFKLPIFIDTILSERILFSIKISIFASTISTILSLTIAIPSAYALSRFDFKGKSAVDIILELPMLVSPAALGAMILIFFHNPIGEWIQNNITQFIFTFYGIILAQFVTTLGMCTRLIKAIFDEIPIRYEMIAQVLGASNLKAFFTVVLPLSFRGIISAAILTWAKALGEFGATITVAGTMALKTETLPIAIFMKLSTADIEGAVNLIIIIILIGLLVAYMVKKLSKNLSYA